MTRRVVSFTWGRGLGHVSRLIAVHTELQAQGWDSLLLTERHQRLIDDHGFRQTVIPTDADSLVGEPLHGTGPAVDHRLAQALVAQALRPDDAVLHDVTVQRELYEHATRLGCPQFLVHRFQRNRPDPAAWVARHTPAIGRVYLLGAPERQAVEHGVSLVGVDDVVRRLLGTRSPWPPDTSAMKVAVVAGGGGHADAAGFLDAALHGVRAYARRAAVEAVDVLVLTGPHFDGHVLVPPGLPGPVRVAPYLGPEYDVYRHATVAITHAGYNTVRELVRSGVPAVAVPGVRDFDDQRVHLRAAAARLNATVAEADARSVADGLAAVLGAGTGTGTDAHAVVPSASGSASGSASASGSRGAPAGDGASAIARDLLAAVTARGGTPGGGCGDSREPRGRTLSARRRCPR
ncbi:glycosyltransferase [Streptomyces sp. NPDC050610]|uniref:glycosyltransferase n=1 Tax=Streptomyces sp. NPDC050610 TaxID=3157097 RepID=UPI0034196972